MVQCRRPQYDVAMSGVPRAATAASIAAVVVIAVVLVTRSEEGTPTAPDVPRQSTAGATTAPTPRSDTTTQGVRCIRGGTTREEVRAIMGEPDSVAFGDWLYGRSSVTFGYGVVLDFTNAGGNLVVCP